jgi:uncharacterized protein (DUF305 family)
MNKNLPSALLLCLSTVSLGALATDSDSQQMQADYMTSMHSMNQQMHQGMMSEDADVAFAAGMLAHHQGAVDMARIQLRYGKDPALLKLAQEVIQAQEPEIKQMQDWLKAHGQ